MSRIPRRQVDLSRSDVAVVIKPAARWGMVRRRSMGGVVRLGLLHGKRDWTSNRYV